MEIKVKLLLNGGVLYLYIIHMSTLPTCGQFDARILCFSRVVILNINSLVNTSAVVIPVHAYGVEIWRCSSYGVIQKF